MDERRQIFVRAYWGFTFAWFVLAIALAMYYAPIDEAMGVAQKILYIHLPTAQCTLLATLIVFAASIGYLWQRHPRWDDLAHAAAEVSVLFGSVVLLTGMVWAKSAWGFWWTWSPKLTFSLALLLFFVAYLVLRRVIRTPERRLMVAAIYGVVAFLDVPLVYLSVKLMPDVHPASVPMTTPMRITLGVWFVPVLLLCVGLVWTRFRLNMRIREHGEHAHDTPLDARSTHA
jgi:heme exporter protein C